MSFPQTRLTLIQRLADGGSDDDWRRFVRDYHGPVCRFALRWGACGLDDAEDLTQQTFAAVWEQRLLTRWASHRTAKLRSLLCAVVRNILANRRRVGAGRQRLLPDVAAHVRRLRETHDDQEDAFYGAWVEDVVQRSIEALAAEYHAAGKGDYIRVFYGRLCRRLSIAEVAQALRLSEANVDHYYRHARDRLAEKLEELVRTQTRILAGDDAAEDFAAEWRELGQYLRAHGGLEKTVERAYELWDPVRQPAAGAARRAKPGDVERIPDRDSPAC